MNTGVIRGVGQANVLPKWAGGEDPSNDGAPVVIDSTAPGRVAFGGSGFTANTYLTIVRSAASVTVSLASTAVSADVHLSGKGAGLTDLGSSTGQVRLLSQGGNCVIAIPTTGSLTVNPSNSSQIAIQVTGVASGVNGIVFTQGATGVTPTIAPGGVGSDANVGLTLKSAGTGSMFVNSASDTGSTLIGGNQSSSTVGQAALTATGVALGVNGITVTQAAASASPVIASSGSDAVIDLTFQAKGSTGHIVLQGNGVSNTALQVSNAASAVNGLQIVGGAAANAVQINVIGGDTNQGMTLSPKGTGSVNIQGGAASSTGKALIVSGVSSAVNQVTITNSATGNPVLLAATGTDTDIGIRLTPKGAGLVDINVAVAAISGTVAPATLATTTGGATGPATATQNTWGKLKFAGTTYFVPLWI